jgi:hypothetical protein
MARTTILVALILWVALTVALPVRRNGSIIAQTLASRTDSRWDEARSLEDLELEDLVQRGPGQAAHNVMAKVKGLGAKLSPSRWAEKRKQQQRQKATLKGAAQEHANRVAWQKQVKTKESVQGAQYHSARLAQKKEKVQAVQSSSQRRKTWSPGQIPGGLPVKLGFKR